MRSSTTDDNRTPATSWVASQGEYDKRERAEKGTRIAKIGKILSFKHSVSESNLGFCGLNWIE